MTKKGKIQALFNATFTESPQWNSWFFDNVYNDDDALFIEQDDHLVSALLMKAYNFSFHENVLKLAYINGVATAQKSRGKGYMHQLLSNAIHEAYTRGFAFAGVIPASDHLFFFYDKFDFSTVVFFELNRYTSAHEFVIPSSFSSVCPSATDFQKLLRMRPASIIHSEADFVNIVRDNEMDNGIIKAVADSVSDNIAAMAFAVKEQSEIVVRELLAVDNAAAQAVLGLVADGIHPLSVHVAPSDNAIKLHPRAMMRITNVKMVLNVLAKKFPHLNQVIRVHDPLVNENNGVFFIRDGICSQSDFTIRHLTLDIDVSTLTSLIFSSERIGNVFGIPVVRPSLPLMLD